MAVLTREERHAAARRAAWPLGQKRGTQIGHVLLHLVLIAAGVSFLAPFVWLLSTSLKQSGTEFAYPPQWIPHPIMWSNYKTALVDVVPFFTYFKNTMTITVGAMVGDVLMSAVAAYSFARLRWPGRNV